MTKPATTETPKLSNYHRNKMRMQARLKNSDPSMTDQSLAKGTEINVILGQFKISGTAPGPRAQPVYGDFSQLPRDLRGFIELGKRLPSLRNQLPEQLQHLTADELLALTPQQLHAKLQPATTTTTEEKKQ